MSQLSDIVELTITRETQNISRASFGTPAIISEFAASKTATTFDRYREYASLTEMTDDSWSSTDKEYIRVQKILSQNPKPSKVVIGRKKPATEAVETWTEALTAIQAATQDWYAFTINPTGKATVTFDDDFVASNSITFTVNTVVCDPVLFSSDQETTMGLIKAEIEGQAGLTDTIVTVSATPFRTLTIELESGDITAVSVSVTGGVSQPSETISYTEQDDVLLAAAWAETQKKIFFHTDNDSTIPTSGTSDLAYQLKALDYDRSVIAYHSGLVSSDQFLCEAWEGKMLPKDPGSATWMFKSLSGITAVTMTSSQRTLALGKNCNIYTATAGVNITEQGKVVSGEYIDIIRGIDWLEATIQENIYSTLINVDKVPFTNEGIGTIEGILRSSLDEGIRAGLLASYTVSAPDISEVSDANKLARTLPDLTFTAILAGAIHKIEIAGTVTV